MKYLWNRRPDPRGVASLLAFSSMTFKHCPVIIEEFQNYNSDILHRKLEQLECLHSEIPSAAPWLPIQVIHIRSQVKTRQSQSYKFKKIAKNANFGTLQETLHATHLLKLLDKMCKYEMDLTTTVGATERTQDAGQTDGRTDGVKPIYPHNFIVWGV